MSSFPRSSTRPEMDGPGFKCKYIRSKHPTSSERTKLTLQKASPDCSNLRPRWPDVHCMLLVQRPHPTKRTLRISIDSCLHPRLRPPHRQYQPRRQFRRLFHRSGRSLHCRWNSLLMGTRQQPTLWQACNRFWSAAHHRQCIWRCCTFPVLCGRLTSLHTRLCW